MIIIQIRFNREWKKVNDEETAASGTDDGVLEGAIARNQIYQRIRRGDSMVIVDPERRLHTREMWIYLTIHGYQVDSYDLDCMDESCCFNCLYGFNKVKTKKRSNERNCEY